MWNMPSMEDLRKMPKLYETENLPINDKIVHEHFFLGNSDWFAIEFDGDDLFFGFAILNSDYQNAEFGYFSLSEITSLKIGPFEIEYDLYWEKRPVRDVGRIQMCLFK